MSRTSPPTPKRVAHATRKPYTPPRLTEAGTLESLTQGFAGSIPDEQGGQTKRNPYQG